jgi:hypothetical protein
MPKPLDSSQFHRAQHGLRITLKHKALKIGILRYEAESVLGTVDRMISFNNLEVDHLSKQQVGAFRLISKPASGAIPLWNP